MAVEADEMAARLRAEFPHALRSGQLVPYFQPEVELSSGRVVAAESLARGEHPDYGTLPPALFTPLAESLGLMGELTRLMLGQSLAQHRTWAAAGWVVPVSVNVGPDCVTDPAFPGVIAEFLRSEQVPGPMLALEVSEQTGTAAVSSSFFAQLAEFGVRVALDDFGTGFAFALRRRSGPLAHRDAGGAAGLARAVDGLVRPPRRGRAAAGDLVGAGRTGRSHRRHGEQDWHRTGGRLAPAPGSARASENLPRRAAVRGGHQPGPPPLLRHGVLAAELAGHAPAGRGPPTAGGHEGREGQRRGHGRADGRHRHRHHEGRGVEEVTDRPREDQPRDDEDGRQPDRGAGITDHGQPLFARVPSRGGRASLPANSYIAQMGGKVKTQS